MTIVEGGSGTQSVPLKKPGGDVRGVMASKDADVKRVPQVGSIRSARDSPGWRYPRGDSVSAWLVV